MNILELYSGIGGMHLALKESGVEGKIVAAVEISPVANSVYSHNFPDTKLLNRNILGLDAKFINDLNINAIFMSPPCQPYTRNGLRRDVLDPRSHSFNHILDILQNLNVKYILIENVKGFETSTMRHQLVDSLLTSNFTFQEFILSPTQLGISNTRHRYYCLAKKSPFSFKTTVVQEELPDKYKCIPTDLFAISDILETNSCMKPYLLRDNTLLRYGKVLDICLPGSRRSCCFTKGYGRYVEGTGSVFTHKSQEEVDKAYKIFLDEERPFTTLPEFIDCVKQLELRFFSPKEVARLMSFPEEFSFPEELSPKTQYKLLGNSINIKVVSKLIQILADNPE